MKAHRRLSVATLSCALWVGACDDGPAPPPPVSQVALEPAQALLSPGDSVVIVGLVVDTEGGFRDESLEFQVEDPSVGSVQVVGPRGRTAVFRAATEGETRVLGREEGGVLGSSMISVRTVRDFDPRFSAFGGVVQLQGVGFGENSQVSFGSAAGQTRSVSSDGRILETWVPWDAENEPLRVTLEDGSEVRTHEPFVLTGGGDDALEPNDVTEATAVDFPFRNPFLKSRPTDMDHFTFSLDEPGPVTFRVSDEEDVNTWQRRLVLQVNEVDGRQEIYGVVPVYSFGRDEPQDGVVSRMSFPAGRYAARIFVAPEFGAVERRFTLDIRPGATFTVEPDAFEPNDLPPESPLVDMPFGPVTARIENPWGQDYYRLVVSERSRVQVVVGTGGSSKGVFFYRNEEEDGMARSVQWYLLNGSRPRTWTGRITFFSPIAFGCTVDPGEYVVAVLENWGVEGDYTLEIQAEPTTSDFFNCVQPGLGASAADELELLSAGVPVRR